MWIPKCSTMKTVTLYCDLFPPFDWRNAFNINMFQCDRGADFIGANVNPLESNWTLRETCSISKNMYSYCSFVNYTCTTTCISISDISIGLLANILETFYRNSCRLCHAMFQPMYVIHQPWPLLWLHNWLLRAL